MGWQMATAQGMSAPNVGRDNVEETTEYVGYLGRCRRRRMRLFLRSRMHICIRSVRRPITRLRRHRLFHTSWQRLRRNTNTNRLSLRKLKRNCARIRCRMRRRLRCSRRLGIRLRLRQPGYVCYDGCSSASVRLRSPPPHRIQTRHHPPTSSPRTSPKHPPSSSRRGNTSNARRTSTSRPRSTSSDTRTNSRCRRSRTTPCCPSSIIHSRASRARSRRIWR